jgi:SH3-like domain-containing protein
LGQILLKNAVPCRAARRLANHLGQFGFLALAGLALLLLGGCARDAGKVPTPTRTRRPPTQAPVRATISLDLPAATQPPSTLGPALTATPPPSAPAAAETAPAATEAPAAPAATAAPSVAPTASAPTEAPEARLTVSGATANARGGPGTSFPIVGSLKQGQAFQVTGKNTAGDWWQVCCVSGQKAWVAASLVNVQNAELVAVAADLPAPAAVVTKPQPAAAPVAPTPKPAAPAAADPCANIGGDGCKWKVTAGPQMAENGGREIKMQLLFIHSGIDGGQPQGGYSIILEKDGQRLPIPPTWRSSPASSNGSLGKYNYELALTLDKLPGNAIAGNYTLWVLDGTGERDSRNINFTISGTQGLLWIKLDQA